MLRSSGFALAMGLALSGASAQPAPPQAQPLPFTITKSDPALDALIAPDAKLATIAAGFGFIDTPVWIRAQPETPGYLLASSIIDNAI